MCKIRLQNCKILLNRSGSWSTRCILEASKLFTTSQNFFLKKGAYCFSITSSVGLNSLRHFNNFENLELFCYFSVTVKKHRSILSILSSWEHVQQRRCISKCTSNGDWKFSGKQRRSFYPPTRGITETVKFTI